MGMCRPRSIERRIACQQRHWQAVARDGCGVVAAVLSLLSVSFFLPAGIHIPISFASPQSASCPAGRCGVNVAVMARRSVPPPVVRRARVNSLVAASAPTLTVKGEVTNMRGRPLAGASVSAGSVTMQTAAAGTFNGVVQPSAQVAITAWAAGYMQRTLSVRSANGAVLTGEVTVSFSGKFALQPVFLPASPHRLRRVHTASTGAADGVACLDRRRGCGPG